MSTLPPEELQRASHWLNTLRSEIGKAVIGQLEAVDHTLIALLACGHVLIEGVPGLGKTLLARALSQALQLRHARVQFTPDLMPSDLTGHAVLDPASIDEGGLGTLRIQHGPVFTQLLLADEINRAPAKTQSALLEVMQEYQVTLEGQTLALPRPFMVMATQNPVDTEGTYPLPEAQMDRFLLKIDIGYPDAQQETAIVALTTEGRAGDQLPLEHVRAILGEAHVCALQRLTAQVRADTRVLEYAVHITRATRDWPGLAAGSGPRGAVALIRAARAAALLTGRDFVTPDDIAKLVLPVLRHRVALSPEAMLEGRNTDTLLRAAADSVQAPRL